VAVEPVVELLATVPPVLRVVVTVRVLAAVVERGFVAVRDLVAVVERGFVAVRDLVAVVERDFVAVLLRAGFIPERGLRTTWCAFCALGVAIGFTR
jgi:hypothetical protein